MEWNRGYTSKIYASIVDPITWHDLENFDILSTSVKRSLDELRQSADLECRNYYNDKDIWVRIWLDIRQNGATSHNALFTGTTAPTTRSIDGRRISTSMSCYSVLQYAQEVMLPRGWYAPAESFGADLVKTLLSIGPAPVTIDPAIEKDQARLKQAIIAENNENRLSMADKVLTAMGLDIKINGLGEITIYKPSKDPIAVYDSLSNDVMGLKVTEEKDWYGCPNVFRATVDDLSAVARDDDPNSKLSTVSRGREIWMEEIDVDLNENESLSAYAMRRLKEEQRYSTTLSYNVRFDPNINVGDVVQINYPAQSLSGNFYITSQSIDIDSGITLSEEAINI